MNAKTTSSLSSLSSVLDFLDCLEVAGLPYRLEHVRNSLMISLATPGERLEIEFFDDGRIEVERFRSTGEIEGEDALEAIFQPKRSHA